MNRHPAHILLLKAARAVELLIAAVILLVIVCGAAEHPCVLAKGGVV